MAFIVPCHPSPQVGKNHERSLELGAVQKWKKAKVQIIGNENFDHKNLFHISEIEKVQWQLHCETPQDFTSSCITY